MQRVEILRLRQKLGESVKYVGRLAASLSNYRLVNHSTSVDEVFEILLASPVSVRIAPLVKAGGEWRAKRSADGSVKIFLTYSPVGLRDVKSEEVIWPNLVTRKYVNSLVRLLRPEEE